MSASSGRKAVKVWTWRRALRDHGPEQQSLLLMLFVIGTYADDSGFAFPGQPLIAKGMRANVRTVRRLIKVAVDLGWLYVEETPASGGRGWRRHTYRCTVPADLELGDVDEDLRDVVVRQFDDPPDAFRAPASDDDEPRRADTIVSAPSSRGADSIVSAPSDRSADVVRTSDADGADISARGADKSSIEVRTQLSPPNSSSEVVIRTKREGTLARPPVCAKAHGSKDAEKRTPEESAAARIRKLLTIDRVDWSPERLAKAVSGATLVLVRQIMAEVAAFDRIERGPPVPNRRPTA